MLQLILSILLMGWFGVEQQATPEPKIDFPVAGQALQGVVLIHGSSAMDNHASAMVEFRYENDPAETWFLVQDGLTAIENDVLASWDTTTITDGLYRLRLKVLLNDGSIRLIEVAGVRVRNYTAVETNTPEAQSEETRLPSQTPTTTPMIIRQTPTPQPPNPVAVTSGEIRGSVAIGLGIMLALFLLAAIYLGLRRLGRS